jgi:altronate hydrolase
VPTLKVSTNTDLFQRKQHWMDFDAGTLVSSGEAMESLLTRFTDLIVATANGMPTRAEQAGIHDIAIWKDGVTL